MDFKRLSLPIFVAAFLLASCQDHRIQDPTSTQLTVPTLATGLVAPIGFETDASGRVFVTEQGTGRR